MYQVIFYEKTFTGVGTIVYTTEQFDCSNNMGAICSLQVLEINDGTSISIACQGSFTGDFGNDDDWASLSLDAPIQATALGTSLFKINNLHKYIRFIITITNKIGRANAKLTLTGNFYPTGV